MHCPNLTFSLNPSRAINSAKDIVSYFFSKLCRRNVDFSGNSCKEINRKLIGTVQGTDEMQKAMSSMQVYLHLNISPSDIITSLHNWLNEEIQVDYDLIQPLRHVNFSMIAY